MATTLTSPLVPRIGAADRLGMTLFLAVALHAIIILGISFVPPDKKSSDLPPTMEVILVHSKSEEKPDRADYLAQVTQQGGGDVKEKVRPSSPFANTAARSEQGNAPQTRPLMAPLPQATPDPHNVVTADRARLKTQITPGDRRPQVPDAVTAAELIPPSQEIARLAAEISQRVENSARQKPDKYITASTRESVAAAYLDAWRMKVERVGNLNYPDEARRANLSGDLMLDVAINVDGSLHSVKVVRSSGYRVLDEGAVRIVQMAAPYASLPQSIRKETDVLHILRTWVFEDGRRLETRP
jgi:protein TonB